MLKFYRKNLWFSLKLLYYKYRFSLILTVPLIILITLGLFALSRTNPDLFNIVTVLIITIPVLLILFVLLAFLLRFAYITGYSLIKGGEEFVESEEISFHLLSGIASGKFIASLIILCLLSLTLGSLIYLHVIPESVDISYLLKSGVVVALKLILIGVALGIIALLIIKLLFIWKIIVILVRFLGKVLTIVLLAVIAIAIFYGLYLVVSGIVDPILKPLFGLSL